MSVTEVKLIGSSKFSRLTDLLFYLAVLLFIIGFTSNLYPQSGWFPQVSGTNVILSSIRLLDTQTGWTVGGNGTILKTTNGGNNWSAQPSGTTNAFFTIYFADANTGWAAGGDVATSNGTIMKTTNGGINWFTQNSGLPNHVIYSIFFLDFNFGWAVAVSGFDYTKILKTTNGGNNWFVTQTMTNQYQLYSIYFVDANTGWTAGLYSVYKTTNGGNNWFFQYSVGSILKSVYFIDANTGLTVGNSFPPVLYGVILKTTNGGDNWFYQSTSGSYQSVFFEGPNIGWTVGSGGTILKTINGGTNWFYQSSGIGNTLNCVHFPNANIGWVCGTGGTILKTTDGGGPVGIVNINSEIPARLTLFQNYPNPFNSSTKFKIQIVKFSKVSVVIYNILGREVEMLINEELKPGSYEIQWDASDYPSGTYFYRLIAGDFIETKKDDIIEMMWKKSYE